MTQLSPNALTVLTKRYLLRDSSTGLVIETPSDMFRRVAHHVAQAELNYGTQTDVDYWEEQFFQIMSDLEFLPNTPTLINAGKNNMCLSACFSLPVFDSMESIMDTAKLSAMVQKSGGGCGFNLSNLRPEGDVVGTTGGASCFEAGTHILTSRGLIEIQEIIPGRDKAILPDGSSHLITHLHPNDIQSVYKITLADGRTISSTISHNFFGFTSEGELSKYEVGNMINSGVDPVLAIVNVPIDEELSKDCTLHFSSKRKFLRNKNISLTIDENMAWLIGLIDGDGYINRSNRRNFVRITCNFKEQKVVEKTKSICLKCGISPRIQHQEHYGRTNIIIGSSVFVEALDSIGLLKDKSANVFIPKFIKESPISIRLAYIAGFFDSDGSNSCGRVTFKTTSNKMAEDLICLLSSVGIPSTLRHHLPSNGNKLTHRIEVIGSLGRDKFVKSVGKFIVKTNFSNTLDITRGRNLGVSFNALKAFITDPKERARLSKYVMPYNATYTSRGTLEYLYNECTNSSNKEAIYVTMNLYSVPISDIEYIGERLVFDITVENQHKYIANGILVSNSGPVSFMKIYDTVTDVVKQGATRRGANSGIMEISHPDIVQFIQCKDDGKAFQNFNISVAITDKFMDAVKNKSNFDLVNPRTGKVVKSISAEKLFDLIAEHAWKTGDPGVCFIDTVNKFNSTPHLGRITGWNPCLEQPLFDYESCTLGSINLNHYVSDSKILWDKLKSSIQTAVQFLDDVIDTNNFPDQRIAEATLKTRKIGLGIMGFADLLIKLGISYNSSNALLIAEHLMSFIDTEAAKASEALADKRGPYPAWVSCNGSLPIRNANRTTIAPTGSISIIADASGGIEPLYALFFTKNVMDGTKLVEVNQSFYQYMLDKGYSDTEIKNLSNNGYKPDPLFATAHDISPLQHVAMQAAFQKYTNSAISKTVNLPNSATVDDIKKVYMSAYDLGTKGITVYRDGSKENQVLSTKTEQSKEAVVTAPRKRLQRVQGYTEKIDTGCGHMYVTVNVDSHGPCEVFVHLGKSGACACAQLEAICRMISLSLRSGVDVTEVIEQLKGIRCPSPFWDGSHATLSCSDAIAKVLLKDLDETETKKVESKTSQGNIGGQCIDCGNILVFQEGCYSCHSCGYTKCG